MTLLGEGCGGNFHYRALFCFDLQSRYYFSLLTAPNPNNKGRKEMRNRLLGDIKAQDKSCTASTGNIF